jgi:hypothetical protein
VAVVPTIACDLAIVQTVAVVMTNNNRHIAGRLIPLLRCSFDAHDGRRRLAA